MKVRIGFISNSSSSSFLLMGMPLDRNDKRIGETEWGKPALGPDSDLRFSYGIEKYYDQIIFGISPREMKDNETLLEFKQRIVNMFVKVGIKCTIKDINFHMDAGYR